VHHAAKNGHMHSLRLLQDLGADVTKVRLSQVKGKAARDFVIAAYKKKAKVEGAAGTSDRGDCDADEENMGEENQVVGYARRQSKSTAFWGPRRTPISGKIKKKILKDKRKGRRGKRKDKETTMQNRRSSMCTDNLYEHNTVEANRGEEVKDEFLFEEPSYLETVKHVKRLKKLKRLQKHGRNACMKNNNGVDRIA